MIIFFYKLFSIQNSNYGIASSGNAFFVYKSANFWYNIIAMHKMFFHHFNFLILSIISNIATIKVAIFFVYKF